MLYERFLTRSHSAERHPGHRDHLNIAEFKHLLLGGELELLDIETLPYHFDTTDLDSLDHESLYDFIDSNL